MTDPRPVYRPQPGVFIGQPPCLCGAAARLHREVGGGPMGVCPVPYRPAHIDAAIKALRRAEAPTDRFIARGEVQRLLGHRPGTCWPMCAGCDALLESEKV